MKPITGREILAARDQPAGAASPGGWSRATLEAWGVPWPTPLFWIHKLIASGVPYAEPTNDQIRSTPMLRAVLWTDPAEGGPIGHRRDLREALAADPAPPPEVAPSPLPPARRSGKSFRKPAVTDDSPRLI